MSLGRLAKVAEAEAFWLEALSHPFRLPKEILSSLATDSSVCEPRRLALPRACSLNSDEYRFLCMLCRSRGSSALNLEATSSLTQGGVSGEPLTLTTVEIKKLADSDTVFNLSGWSGWSGLTEYYVDAISGALTSSPY